MVALVRDEALDAKMDPIVRDKALDRKGREKYSEWMTLETDTLHIQTMETLVCQTMEALDCQTLVPEGTVTRARFPVPRGHPATKKHPLTKADPIMRTNLV